MYNTQSRLIHVLERARKSGFEELMKLLVQHMYETSFVATSCRVLMTISTLLPLPHRLLLPADVHAPPCIPLVVVCVGWSQCESLSHAHSVSHPSFEISPPEELQ